MTTFHYLIIGNGAAGLSAAEVIRQRDSHGRITILSHEPYLFYSRPGVAYVILDQVSEQQVIARSPAFYQEHRFDLRLATAVALEPERQLVYLETGEPVGYDVLLLATGSTAVPAPFPGGDLEGILYLDNLDDAKRLIRYGRRAKAAVVVGGGITAMEMAEGLQHQGARTSLLQRGDRIWPRLFDEQESAIIEQQANKHGIELRYRSEIDEVLEHRGKVAGVRLKDGHEMSCQIVGVAIGVTPNRQLVQDMPPINQDKGILVNAYMQSSVPTLFAAGDLAQVPDRWTGKPQLDVLWPSAINEGRAAGYNMVDVAHGRSPGFAYQKGSPFNAALLFGVHLTVIGRIGGGAVPGNKPDETERTYLSRGSSHVWTAPFTSHYRSAWDKKGVQSLRLVMANGRIVGALLMGNQELADPLRYWIEEEVDLSAHEEEILHSGPALPGTLRQIHRQLST
jgi:NADPH-dependent 2,4-dienoyl-CoA reductase/sulfur reductase-like enzyme